MSNSTTAPTRLTALSNWRRSVDISKTTAWRLQRKGLINPININGRLYLTQSDIDQYQKRAEAGEFARNPKGAAALVSIDASESEEVDPQ